MDVNIYLCTLTAVIGYVFWKKYHDKDFFWLLLVSLIALGVKGLRYYLLSYDNLPDGVSAFFRLVFMGFWAFVVLFGVWLASRGFQRKIK